MLNKGDHILSTKQFNKESLIKLFNNAKEMEEILNSNKKSKILEGKILATLFFEPSTRTRFSFESAMYRLGGSVISNYTMNTSSSIKKRETLEDTGKVISQLADIIVARHPKSGSVQKIASKSDVPVINAGDGSTSHPSQGLLDLYTIWKKFKKLDGLTIGMIGDLKYGRVPHSECSLLKHFNINFIFVSPPELAMPNNIIKELEKKEQSIKIVNNFEEFINKMDVIACTRIQEERFNSKEEYEKYSGRYILDKKLLNKAKTESIIIHPLPRVDEIPNYVDNDKRAKYFEQIKNGLAIRMALLKAVLL